MRYTSDDDRYITEHWQTMGDPEMGDALGKTHFSVAARRYRLGFSRVPQNRDDVHVHRQIVELWGGYTALQIARMVYRDTTYVYAVAKAQGLGPSAPRAKPDCATHIVRPDPPKGIQSDAIIWAKANYGKDPQAALILGMAGVRP